MRIARDPMGTAGSAADRKASTIHSSNARHFPEMMMLPSSENGRPKRPTRSWRNSTGPGEVVLMMTATVIKSGDSSSRADAAATRSKARFDARVIPSVAYTDPEVAWVGLTEDEAKAQGIAVKKGLFPWTASGRAIANGRDEGFTKLLFDARPPAGASRPGGNARTFDWRILACRDWQQPWLLAGGLTAANVMEAVRLSGAVAVDVSSGVEDSPGHKDPALIRDFLARVAQIKPATHEPTVAPGSAAAHI
mgnify:CR=1 FL=1